MKNDVKSRFADKVRDFRLPRYSSLANVGLYLEQVTTYINGILCPIGFPEMTPSMVSNYVKKGLIDSPVKRKYYAEQIAYLIFVAVGKSVVSIDDISALYKMQKDVYPADVAYDYFCEELENMLMYLAGMKDTVEDVGVTNTDLKTVLRSLIISVSNLVFVTNSLEVLREKNSEQ